MGTDVAGISRGWKNRSCRDPAVMEFVLAETPPGCFIEILQTKTFWFNVRILGKLSREISYMAAKYVVDSGSTIFWSCCEKRRCSDAGQLQYTLTVKLQATA